MIKPRTLARRLALQYCFACDLNDRWDLEGWLPFLDDCDAASDSEGIKDKAVPFARELVEKVVAGREAIDASIAACTRNWKLERLAAVERNVLRVAAAELADGQLDKRIVISEAVWLAQNFGSKDSGKFVNGVLDAMAARV